MSVWRGRAPKLPPALDVSTREALFPLVISQNGLPRPLARTELVAQRDRRGDEEQKPYADDYANNELQWQAAIGGV